MDKERRRYFRIEDQVAMSVQPLADGNIDARLKDFWENQHAFSIRNNYNFQIEQHIADFNKIENRMPELARYLSVLEKQIDRITGSLIDDGFDQSLAEKRASLSAQGLAWHDRLAVSADTLVELNLKLLPSGFRLVIIARVVKVDSDSDHVDGSRISLDFEHIHEADREILIKHIHAKQMESLSIAQ